MVPLLPQYIEMCDVDDPGMTAYAKGAGPRNSCSFSMWIGWTGDVKPKSVSRSIGTRLDLDGGTSQGSAQSLEIIACRCTKGMISTEDGRVHSESLGKWVAENNRKRGREEEASRI